MWKSFSYNEMSRNEFRERYHLQNKYVIGHIGRFNMQKNHEKLITIYEEISKQREDAVLVLIGDGELREKFKGWQRKSSWMFGLSDLVMRFLMVAGYGYTYISILV